MAEWALQVTNTSTTDLKTSVREKDNSWKSTTVNRSCDTADSLNASIGPHTGDLFNSGESDDQVRPVPAPRVRKLAVSGLPVPAPQIRRLAMPESHRSAPRVSESVGRDNYRLVELQSMGRSESTRSSIPDVTVREYRTPDKFRSHAKDNSRSRRDKVSKRQRDLSSDNSSGEIRRSHHRSKHSEKRRHRRDSSSSPDDSLPARRRRRGSVTFREDSRDRKIANRSHKDSIKLERYDGSTPFESFLVQFENCSEYNCWDSDDKLLQLKGALRGPAAQLLLNGGSFTTFHDLCRELRQCFGTEGCENQFESQLKMRRRHRGESLRGLYQDVNRLVLQAYPGSQNKLRDRLAVEAFITSLNDKDLELRVRDRCPANLLECFRTAMMMESNQLIVQGNDNAREKRRQMERTDVQARAIDSGDSDLRETAELKRSREYHNANTVTSDQRAVLDQYIKVLEERLQKYKEKELAQSENLSKGGPIRGSGIAGQWNEQSFSPQSGRPRQPVVCFRCGRPGHVVESCRVGTRSTCYKCGQLGHLQSFCKSEKTSDGPPRH